MPSVAGLDKIGIAGVAIMIMWFGFKVFQLFVQQWKQSTEAVNRNTKSFDKLASIFEKQNERELRFQQEVMAHLHDGNILIRETHQRVNDIHGKIVIRTVDPQKPPSEWS